MPDYFTALRETSGSGIVLELGKLSCIAGPDVRGCVVGSEVPGWVGYVNGGPLAMNAPPDQGGSHPNQPAIQTNATN